MNKLEVKESDESMKAMREIVNDFSITVGTVNGSGSQTSNLTILRSIFKMGIPVSGKNIFPSNIQGLPTWYTIRVSKDGYLARREEHEIVIAMNPVTFNQDLNDLVPGGALFYADHIKEEITRDDIVVYPMPVKQLVSEMNVPGNLKDYVANMVYVGILAEMIGIDYGKIEKALDFHFKGKKAPIDMNFGTVKLAGKWASENLNKEDLFVLEPMDKTDGFIMSDGNTSGALGSIYGGVEFVSWYPITPASSLAESLNYFLPMLRKDPKTGKNTFAVVQTEDELAAVGMAIGAGWAGLRSMTSTSGPGISLMSEFTSLAYYSEVPLVIWDVQRMGPSTGLPTRTSQGDINQAYFLGHGDTKHILLFPSSIRECFEFGWKSLDLAEQLQTPVFIISDLDLGLNQWMSEPFTYPDTPIKRGKVLWEEDLEKLKQPWGRYLDIDGDGIPYRTVPGNRHPKSAYFARGTGHDEFANYSEDPAVWSENMERLNKKFDTARQLVPKPIVENDDNADIAIIAFGSTHHAIKEAVDILKKDGVTIDYMRLRSLPFTKEVSEFVMKHNRIYVIEMNRDGQMNQLLVIEYPEIASKFISVTHNDGMQLTAKWIVNAIMDKEAK